MKQLKFLVVILLSFITYSSAQERDLAITIYNNDLAVVKDVRKIQLSKGRSQLKYQNVAAAIDPTSVHFKSLTAPDVVAIIEQNYEYDLVNTQKILEKYVDKDIKVYLKTEGLVEGKLLNHESAFKGQPCPYPDQSLGSGSIPSLSGPHGAHAPCIRVRSS